MDSVELDSTAVAARIPDDPDFSEEWGMTRIQAPRAWDVTTGSKDIIIAIVDTGINLNHPDLASKIVASKIFGPSLTANDKHEHGTYVAGVAAAISDNGLGVAGLGYNSSLMNVKVSDDEGKANYSWIAQGIIWAADNGANVINVSLCGDESSTTLEEAVDYAWNKGAVVVAAAGNNGRPEPSYPAYYGNAIAVGATDPDDRLYSFSNYGSWVDVAAPGTALSTSPDGKYGIMGGSSIASPFVAGLAGLAFSVATDTNGDGRLNDEVRSMIEDGSDVINASGVRNGRINAYRTVSAGHQNISGSVRDIETGRAAANFSLYKILTGSTMWVNTINFVPFPNGLLLKIKVVNPEPVGDVRTVIGLNYNNVTIDYKYGITNAYGESYWFIENPPRGYYTAAVLSLAGPYTWNSGLISVAYNLAR